VLNFVDILAFVVVLFGGEVAVVLSEIVLDDLAFLEVVGLVLGVDVPCVLLDQHCFVCRLE